jgi:hypothetical protein
MAREVSASGLRATAMPHPLVPLGRDGSRDAETPLPDLLAAAVRYETTMHAHELSMETPSVLCALREVISLAVLAL